ncbi:MAG TPA: serine hydrolase, partial [Rhizomicrobium sp.]|nr:serine hydrolase [Rhizomicrobium sp.]
MRHWLPIFLLLAASGAQAAPVDTFIRAEMVKRHIPGLAVAILKAGKTVTLSGYGIANLETGTSVTG